MLLTITIILAVVVVAMTLALIVYHRALKLTLRENKTHRTNALVYQKAMATYQRREASFLALMKAESK